MNTKALWRFASKFVEDENGCWVWTAGKSANGYGAFKLLGKQRGAHCVSYEYSKGTIPPGLELDHLCRNRACVNPDHLEAVTRSENHRRGLQGPKTRCPRGHLYLGNNLYIAPDGTKRCKICRSLSKKRSRQRKREILWQNTER